MRIVEVIKSFDTFQAGKKYVLAEDVEGQYRSIHGDKLGMSYPIEQVYKPYKGEDLTGKSLFLWRTGGLGDIMFLQPVLRYLKKKYPTCSLYAASACKQSLENMPELSGLYDMPFDVQLIMDKSFHLQFQGIIEAGSEESKRTHATDMFFSYFSIDSTHLPDEDKIPRLTFTKAEMDWASATISGWGVKKDDWVVGVQMETSSPLRNFPKEKLKAVVDTLVKEPGVKVVMIGSAQHEVLGQFYKGGNPNVINATSYDVRRSIVLATRYDLVISPDSFMIQVAGALDKPLIGLYGPFPGDVRMKYFKNAVSLEPSVVCAPCFKHDFRGCIKGHPSPCFTLVGVEDVLQAADHFKHKSTGKHFGYMAPMLQDPNVSDIEKYMLGVDKGLCFFPGRWRHPNVVTVDPNPFARADIRNLAQEIRRESVPFVLYMNDFSPKFQPVYANSKGLVRPGGYYLVYMRDGNDRIFDDLKKDLGGSGYVLMGSKFDPVSHELTIAAKKPY